MATELRSSMTLVREDPFFDVRSSAVTTSQGSVELPILYRDSTCVQAFFLCDLDRVRAALLDRPFDPGLVIGRRALVSVAFFEYRDTSIGVYNEAGIAVPVVPYGTRPRGWRELLWDVDNPRRELGFHILHLPVTTAIANAGGREIWGYPKFITSIPFALEGARLRAEVRDPDCDSSIVSLSGRMGPALRVPTMSLLLYSRKNGRWLRTSVNARGTTRASMSGSVRLQTGSSEHAMAKTLRKLDLTEARPVMVSRCTDFQSRLNEGLSMSDPGSV
ncbi:acetoacetate decarboxylase family protein [Algiphilus aromaticivorans]|uniref:acetoacetate decarboxylase family protein n=1 Tax=Algiphilus aromaticivorans TaxID=382454 RepID=UPI000694F978|nr:acetoacetate decarboxylase family protein [Algiphilus aromaticivorans]